MKTPRDILTWRVYHGETPIGGFPSLQAADNYARDHIGHHMAHYASAARETGYHVGRYAPSENVTAPIIRYVLGPEGIERFGYTPGSPGIDRVRFERICIQMESVEQMFQEKECQQ